MTGLRTLPPGLLDVHDEFAAIHGSVCVSLRTLVRRAHYGGRKGRRAIARLRTLGWDLPSFRVVLR